MRGNDHVAIHVVLEGVISLGKASESSGGGLEINSKPVKSISVDETAQSSGP